MTATTPVRLSSGLDSRFLLGVAAVVIGLAAGFSTIYGLKHRSEVGAVVAGMATAIGLTTVALVVVVLRVGGDWFALIHLGYVVVTIGVPLAATVVLIRA